MKTKIIIAGLALIAMSSFAQATSVSEREYKRGYKDCLVGQYDQYQHGASYKRGCRAAEESGKANRQNSHSNQNVNKDHMKAICDGAVTGRFNPHVRSVRVGNVEQQDFGWGVYGSVVLDDGATADYVCMFSAAGVFKRVNASEPMGASYEMDHEGYCPPDVSQADRYKYPGCN
jgi:hypothetical protein